MASGGVAVGAVDLALGQVAEAPLGQLAGAALIALDRLHRVAGHEQPAALDQAGHLDRVVDALVGADQAEAEQGAAVVGAGRVGADDRVRDHAQLVLGDALGGERVAAGLGVCDHALEAAVERVPDALLGGGAALGVVVSGVDERGAAAQQHAVDLGDGEPLHVHDVGVAERQLGEAEGMLGHLQRHAQARAAEQAGRERVEDQAAAVALGLGHLPEAEAGGDQLHVLAPRGQRASRGGGRSRGRRSRAGWR